jgi:hypothetical protein
MPSTVTLLAKQHRGDVHDDRPGLATLDQVGSCPSCCRTEYRLATPQWSVIFPS